MNPRRGTPPSVSCALGRANGLARPSDPPTSREIGAAPGERGRVPALTVSGRLPSGNHVKVPANIEPFVRVLGVEGAVEFLLAFGGAELYLAKTPSGRSELAKLVGRDKAAELARLADDLNLPRRVPLAKRWIALTLKNQGLPHAQIARKMRVSDVTVRGYIQSGRVSHQLEMQI
jgi:hypothetical protein